MGSHHKHLPKHKHRYIYIVSYKMLYLPHLLLACVGLAAAAPRKYGQDRQCRTEYKTVYETEYEEIENHTCVTKWVPDCKTVYERVCKPIYREEVHQYKQQGLRV